MKCWGLFLAERIVCGSLSWSRMFLQISSPDLILLSLLFWGEVPRKLFLEDPRQNPPKFIHQKSPTYFCRGPGQEINKVLLVWTIVHKMRERGLQSSGKIKDPTDSESSRSQPGSVMVLLPFLLNRLIANQALAGVYRCDPEVDFERPSLGLQRRGPHPDIALVAAGQRYLAH